MSIISLDTILTFCNTGGEMKNFFRTTISDITIVLAIGIILMTAVVFTWARLFEATLTMYEGPRIAIYIQPKPNVSWATYNDPDLEFSIKYPEDYEIIPVAISDKGSTVLHKSLEFSPKNSKDPGSSIRLLSYNRGNSADIPAWLQIHASVLTPEETAPFGEAYALYNVSTPSASVISNRPVYTLSGDLYGEKTRSEVSVFLGNQNVYLISHAPGLDPFIYQQMLSSFVFNTGER